MAKAIAAEGTLCGEMLADRRKLFFTDAAIEQPGAKNGVRVEFAGMRMSDLVFRVLLLLGAWLAWSGPSRAEIRIAPEHPLEGQSVRITLSRQYLSETGLLEGSVSRQGSQITITQPVLNACFLPSAPTLSSTFEVGPLPRGTYEVTTIAPFVVVPGCLDRPALVESTTFVVGAFVNVPVAHGWLLFGLAILLALGGLQRLKREWGPRNGVRPRFSFVGTKKHEEHGSECTFRD